MQLNLGIVSDEICRDFPSAVSIGKRAGLLRYEVRNLRGVRVPNCDAADLRTVEETIERENIKVTAISPGLFKYTEDTAAFHKEMSEIYPRAAELVSRWGLTGMIVFGFHKPGASEANAGSIPSDNPPGEIIEWLTEAAERAAADHLNLIIEPEPICWADTCQATVDLIRRAGAKSIRINYDPGNVAWLQNRDPLDDFSAAAPWIANVHIKDLRPLTRGAGNPEWVPAGAGMIDYRAHFRVLQEAGYQGPVSLEPHMNGSEETTRACAEAVRRLWRESFE
ncbi:MAG TPA: sugar phosphate isomerase/epimerase [Bryobacteraceae bacterium]|nr:sugar phosphate isomerase/epimerase [Bryobacteraceae bacterium]